MLLVLVMTVLYADYSISENGKKFCDIITTVNDAYQDPDVPEPTTDLGRKLKKNYAELEERLRC
jgi:hypothetical protein